MTRLAVDRNKPVNLEIIVLIQYKDPFWGTLHRKQKKEVASEVGLVTHIFPLKSLNL